MIRHGPLTFTSTEVDGAFLISSEVAADDRGRFWRTFDAAAFAAAGIDLAPGECSISSNARRGTLRGLHFQAAPGEESKLVRCSSGRAFDVAVDLRPESSTYRRWTAVELDASSPVALYVPPGCAHGFLTLEDDTDVSYVIDAPYQPELARGVRWDDPSLGIPWPFPPVVLSPRDAALPLLD